MFTANPNEDWSSWDYIQGDLHGECGSIAVKRFQLIRKYHWQQPDLKLALRTIDNKWTKWLTYDEFKLDQLMNAYEIHRGLLDNEIVIESDYPTYDENYEAVRFLGTMLEAKGYIPHYFYSGSKSIHIHLFIDYTMFTKIPMDLQLKLKGL